MKLEQPGVEPDRKSNYQSTTPHLERRSKNIVKCKCQRPEIPADERNFKIVLRAAYGVSRRSRASSFYSVSFF